MKSSSNKSAGSSKFPKLWKQVHSGIKVELGSVGAGNSKSSISGLMAV